MSVRFGAEFLDWVNGSATHSFQMFIKISITRNTGFTLTTGTRKHVQITMTV
jgi:hypothetical protein